ncbi:hypothetical protein LCGC14_2110710 [marine sediment metagenome]|uniref:Uncharacterized protein n=1 Tax=marine sediment metagenome TaxID=412755 RepID=A0A0F9GKE1_9ZZZZ
MNIEQIIKLSIEAAEGKDNVKEGVVGSNGYGFVFKDLNSNILYVTDLNSQRYCEAGSMRGALKIWKKDKNFEDLQDLSSFNEENDLLLAGSLKTLVPTLQFGGYEMFGIWMFVRTPKDRMFPAILYWGVSGVTIGGWSSYGITPFAKEIIFPEDFLKVINFTPFNFTDDERGCFLDALEFSLKKVPISDFWGVFNRDIGNSYMGVKRGEPFNELMQDFKRDPEAEKELEPLLGKEFTGVYNEQFIINLLPGMRIYVMEFKENKESDDLEENNKLFGDAKEILRLWKFRMSTKKNNIIQ